MPISVTARTVLNVHQSMENAFVRLDSLAINAMHLVRMELMDRTVRRDANAKMVRNVAQKREK